MFHVVLYQPEIPPNTGNVIRLCANTGCQLHLIRPLGFALDDRRLRRAGLDYHEWAQVQEYDSLLAFAETVRPPRSFAMSTRGARPLADVRFAAGDAFVFGPETRGLPDAVLDAYPPEQRLRLPMRPHSRSLNLSNSVAVTVFEAWRQNGYAGGA
ncbi:tRNA (uridine(34)/cytosine(34)/5-carboxymethylaminomethyluridine(34)-2'-O)-methyltransferase TrmL [Acidihalobacter prosperus]|uniref:tRNA (cytidine(34)-2'-O)-methyltransferase n=1 Tax=Acidihalobacter prosperus TaxID=160660 RepID=A0A1A6C4A3_9GAMM|nr:tRNA (uridine(34)/cytosine(34)/5-carboxymethylaminomethyluridine(34)-2'-O)-methyltransferase TrmL [Acidihalobacter prosperus]OBS09393.1 tRNA (cytidine(34)-2'-O)-methyltransferase [Acidihalobacter prosperus]